MGPTRTHLVCAYLSVALAANVLLAGEADDAFLKGHEKDEKIKQSGLSEDEIALAKKFKPHVYLFGMRGSDVLKHMIMTDEELWDWLPHAVNGKVLPRTAPGHDYGHGCPIHGAYKGDKRLLWKWTPDRPYKVQCRTGDEWLPTNDYGAYVRGGRKEKLDCRQKYVDDGRGCIAGGKRCWCAGAANYFLYSYIIQLRSDLTSCWKSSGSPVFLRKAMLVWASIAKDYPLMNYGRQNVGAHPSWWLGKMTCWGYDDEKLADHFNDRELWQAAAKDEKLKEFLATKGIAGDLKAYIFRNVMLELYHACYTKNWFLSQGVGGERYQHIIQRWDNDDPKLGPTNEALAKQAEGTLWRNLYNNVYRDGVNTEISAAYGMMSQNQMAKIVGDRLKQGKPVPKTTRLRNALCGSVRLIVIDKFIPNIGDAPFCPYTPNTGRGSAMTGALAKGGKGTGESAGLRLGVELFDDVTVAKWLHQSGRLGKASEELTKRIQAEGDDMALGSRALTAYGLGVLESGPRGNRRAVTMFWGPEGCGSHAHSDMLNIELFAFGKTLAPDLGYPEETGANAKRQGWTAATVSHSTVVVNRRSSGRVFGSLNCLKTFPGFHTMDVSSEQSVFGGARPPDRVFRRQLALVDVGENDFYAMDVFRVKGGSQHDWIFHANHVEEQIPDTGPKPAKKAALPELGEDEDEDEVDRLLAGKDEKKAKPEPKKLPAHFVRRVKVRTAGLELSDPTKWMLLSDYQKSIGKGFRGTQYLHHPQFAKPGDQWSVTWDTGHDVNVRMTMLKGCASEAILADGEPPYRKGAPKFLKYVLARHDGKDGLSSNYVAFLEAYKGEPVIQSVTDLRTKGDAWSDVAVRVEARGRTDLLFSTLDASRLRKHEPGIEFRGSQAFVSQKGGVVESACLIGSDPSAKVSSILAVAGISLEITGSLQAKVLEIDPDAGTFVTQSAAVHAGLVGEIMVLGNRAHKCAYRVDAVTALGADKWRIQLEADTIVGLSPMKEVSERKVSFAERITTYRGRFAGMTLQNEDGTAQWRIVGSDMNSATVSAEGPPLDEALITDTDGDLKRCLKVCDFGPGDDWFIPSHASLERFEKGYTVRANTQARVLLPKGTTLSRRLPDGTTKPVAISGDQRTYEIAPK